MKWSLWDAHKTALTSMYEYMKLNVMHWKSFRTRYETLMSLIGYCVIANQLWWKHIVPQKCSFRCHAKWEPKRLRSSIYFTSVVSRARHVLETFALFAQIIYDICYKVIIEQKLLLLLQIDIHIALYPNLWVLWGWGSLIKMFMII